MAFDPTTSVLAGMDDSVLRSRLAQMQQDYLDLQSGRKLESANYSQGDGGKGVTFTRADLAQLRMAIRELQLQLGIICQARRPLRVFC